MNYLNKKWRNYGVSRTPTYTSWLDMKKRCDDSSRWAYKYYGGRGISYDPRWKRFRCFLEDMGERPEGYEIDRIDNNKGYTKENCRWATHLENSEPFRKRLRSDNKSGTVGVHWNLKARKWFAVGMYKGRREVLYYGDDLSQAVFYRKSWEEKLKLEA